ncbi:CDP-diacylglycerol--serine O-phosphatidyltransferase [Thermohalobacter berrensis]|uniref:CDP-diacylglycerol--serine O-phosphatidyltransferase n=1 Tax=Thermohalobacter berrensis TaxID=99594 RepID=A0A419T281_9FIRM|nr:CDP-diacylglycerol--serine O-phosphatidyltransferase [Thermohalobacter berrensis]RKD31553.1 CDP-diacylglycerol--serine O-phosphatidyltransferase [Thermohalobacter berrensis]
MGLKAKIPNFFTILNLCFGILSILYIFDNDYYISSVLILMAALFDRFDGKLARKFNATTNIGKELDSLCDLISFGVAPSILIWNIQLVNFGIIGIIITIVFAISGAYRLARYNVTEFDGIYMGIPITLCGGVLAVMSIYTVKYNLNLYFTSILMLLLSYGMISTKIKLKKR